METNAKKILEALPTYEDYIKLAEQIKILSLSKMRLENNIKTEEANSFRTVMTDPQFFVNQKAVSVSYFENAYKSAGIHGEITELRNSLADIVAELELKRNQFEIYRQMHDLYKSMVYMEKTS